VEEPAVSLLRQTACAVLKPIAFSTILGFVLLWITAMAGAQMAAVSQSGAQKQLSDLTTSLANGAGATIDILHMPDRIEPPVSVTPESLEKWCRITITDVHEWSGRDEFIDAMSSSRLTADSRMPDLCSAVIFYSSTKQRIGALYFGRFFRSDGAVGSIPVSFKGDLSSWLKHTIPSSLQ